MIEERTLFPIDAELLITLVGISGVHQHQIYDFLNVSKFYGKAHVFVSPLMQKNLSRSQKLLTGHFGRHPCASYSPKRD